MAMVRLFSDDREGEPASEPLNDEAAAFFAGYADGGMVQLLLSKVGVVMLHVNFHWIETAEELRATRNPVLPSYFHYILRYFGGVPVKLQASIKEGDCKFQLRIVDDEDVLRALNVLVQHSCRCVFEARVLLDCVSGPAKETLVNARGLLAAAGARAQAEILYPERMTPAYMAGTMMAKGRFDVFDPNKHVRRQECSVVTMKFRKNAKLADAWKAAAKGGSVVAYRFEIKCKKAAEFLETVLPYLHHHVKDRAKQAIEANRKPHQHSLPPLKTPGKMRLRDMVPRTVPEPPSIFAGRDPSTLIRSFPVVPEPPEEVEETGLVFHTVPDAIAAGGMGTALRLKRAREQRERQERKKLTVTSHKKNKK